MWLEAELAVSPRTELEIVGVAVVNDHSDQVELPAYADIVVDDETIEDVDSVVLEPDTLELTLLVTDELVVDSAALEVVVDDVLASTVEELAEDKVVLPKIPLEDALLVLGTEVVVATSDVEALVVTGVVVPASEVSAVVVATWVVVVPSSGVRGVVVAIVV